MSAIPALPVAPTSPGIAWARDGAAALVGVMSALAIVLTLGLLAWASLGEDAAATGLAAAFATTSVSAMVVAVGSRSTVPVGGPSSATALLLAALLAHVFAGDSGPPALPGLLLCAGAAVCTMGLLQVAMAAAGLARLVHYVPQSVLAGFMNGVALLVLSAQLPTLLGHWGVIRVMGVSAGPALLGLGTAALVWLVGWAKPSWPATLLALVAGMAAWALARHTWPGVDLGPAAAADLGGWPTPLAVLALDARPALALLREHLGTVLLTGVLLGLIGSMESLMSLAAIEQMFNRRPDPTRELLVLGLANLSGGLFAALPCVGVRARAMAMIRAGATGRRPALMAALWTALLFGAGGFVLGWVPMAALAGVMVTVAVGLVDRWSLGLLRRWLRTPRDGMLVATLLTVAAVCALTVTLGLVVGVGVGLVLSAILVVRGLNRSLIRARFTGAERPSRRVWLPADEARLQGLRAQVLLLELEGSLFFGSGQRLTDEAAALPRTCTWLLLDLHRLSTVDDSGAMTLVQLAQMLRRDGRQLVLGGLATGHGIGQHLQVLGLDPADPALPWFTCADLAMEHIEHRLLGPREGLDAAMPLSACTLAAGLSAQETAALAEVLQPRELAAGEWLFHQGDVADSLFVVTRGSVSAVGDRGVAPHRFSSLPAGTMVGEIALLSGGGRSAGVVADAPAQVLELTRAHLTRLQQDQPQLAAALYRNMAAHLAQRLRAATLAWLVSAS